MVIEGLHFLLNINTVQIEPNLARCVQGDKIIKNSIGSNKYSTH